MNKCEWKDGKFEGCNKAKRYLFPNFLHDRNGVYMLLRKDYDCIIDYCPLCGADIRKPEEKPLIVKLGDTWVAHFEGVDYLWIHSSVVRTNKYDNLNFELDLKTKLWKPFSEITLDDEIAKLRPLVVLKDLPSAPVKLWGVDGDRGIFSGSIAWLIGGYRLATPHELQEDHIANKQ